MTTSSTTTSEDLPTRYNRLLGPLKANETFVDQLALAFPGKPFDQALKQLLSELAPVFSDANDQGRPIYAVWLLHGHYKLSPDQLMVARRLENDEEIMRPMDKTLPRIFPERWDNLGDALEHRQLAEGDTPLPPPSEEIWSGFTAVMRDRQITMLGISLAPDERKMEMLEQGYLFQETTGFSDKSHIVKAVQNSVLDPVITTAWIPSIFPSNGDGLGNAELATPYRCSHNCTVGSHCQDT